MDDSASSHRHSSKRSAKHGEERSRKHKKSRREHRDRHEAAAEDEEEDMWVEKAPETEEIQTSASISDQVRRDDAAGEPEMVTAKGSTHVPAASSGTPSGGPGSKWNLMKLRRTYEIAEDEGRPVEEVASERYGSLEAFEQAKKEHGDSRYDTPPPSTGSRRGAGATDRPAAAAAGERAAPLAQGLFRRPTSDYAPSPRGTPAPAVASSVPASGRGTPIPRASTGSTMINRPDAGGQASGDANRKQAAELRARLLGKSTTDAPLEAGGPPSPAQTSIVEVLPTLDARGRLYDLGTGAPSPAPEQPGARKKKEPKIQTHDPKTGELLRINADDDTTTLDDMVRHERLQGGARAEKDLDAEFAAHIMSDSRFETDLDYIDDNAERLARKKVKTDASKRLFALNDYARTKKALDSCLFCPRDDGAAPKATVVASGTRVYLASPTHESLVEGHCLIVPMQHVLSTLELEDDAWTEIQNFMKCLMRMFADRDQGVIFYETVVSLRHQRHTFIEAVPLPWEIWDDIGGYFKESILAAGSEWAQNRKLVDFSQRPGGFRRSLVPTLPYFMVQWDYHGKKGFGHVIEDDGEQGSKLAGEDEEDVAAGLEDDKGGAVNRHFAAEIIGNLLDLEPRKWRRPRRLDWRQEEERLRRFEAMYSSFDWTKQIAG